MPPQKQNIIKLGVFQLEDVSEMLCCHSSNCEVVPCARSVLTNTDTKQIRLPSLGQKHSLSPPHYFCLPMLSTTPSLTQGVHSFSQRNPSFFANLAETPAAEVSPFQGSLEYVKTHFLQEVFATSMPFLYSRVSWEDANAPETSGQSCYCRSLYSLVSVLAVKSRILQDGKHPLSTLIYQSTPVTKHPEFVAGLLVTNAFLSEVFPSFHLSAIVF